MYIFLFESLSNFSYQNKNNCIHKTLSVGQKLDNTYCPSSIIQFLLTVNFHLGDVVRRDGVDA